MNVNTTTPDANAHGDHNEGNPAMTDATISTENTPPAQGETIALEPTDLMNAKILTALHGKDMRYSYEFGIWFIWDDKRFCPDKTGEAMRRAKTVTSDLLRRAGATDDTAMQKKLTKWALATQSERALKAMLELAKSEPGIAITADQLDRDKWLLNVANGTIDLKTGKRKPHDRADLITKLAPVSYDEHDDGTHCPEWVKFLDHMMPDTDRRAFLQRWLGYNLTGITTERAMAIFHGEGGGGKSTVIRLGAAMLGDYAMRTPTETLLTKREGGIPNDVARLRGARFVFASESDEGRRLSEAFIKDITGTDVMSARFMRGEWFDFTPECKITLGTNHKPLIRGSDEAIWNRIKLFPFTVIIPPEERDLGLFDRLLAELPGILAWAVKGCLDWQRDGLGNPDAIREATASYRNDMDTFGLWLDECCDLDTHAATPVSILYASYEEWMDDAGEHVPSKRAFGLKMQERGFTADRSTAARRWQGVKLKRLGEPTLLPVATPAAAPLEVDMGRVRTRTSGGGFTRDA